MLQRQVRFGVVVALMALGLSSLPSAAARPPAPPPPAPPADPAIAYTSASFGDLMVMNADGTNATAILKQTAATRGKNPQPATSYGQPDWSPDGTRLVCVSKNGPGIYVVNRDGTGLHKIASLSDTNLVNPVWSPAPVPGIGGDKYRIAYTDVGNSGEHDVWIVDEDGQNAVNVSNTPGAEFFPTWSPSGTQLLCQTFSAAIRDRYGLMDFMTGTFTDVQYPAPLAGHYVRQPSWSKTQENVIVVEGSLLWPGGVTSSMDVWRVDLSGFAAPVNLTNTSDQSELSPSLSPGDDAIVFTFGGGVGGIAVMNADGTGRHSISSTGTKPSWRRNP